MKIKNLIGSLIALVAIIGFVSGCFNSGGPKYDGFRFYEKGSGLNLGNIEFTKTNPGIVYADIVSISQCTLAMPIDGSSMQMGVVAEYWDNGVKINVPVDMVQDYSGQNENECFTIVSIILEAGGGSLANLAPLIPGKSRLVASYNGESGSIPIYNFDCISVNSISIGSGLKIDPITKEKSVTTNITECFISRNSTGFYIVSELCYRFSIGGGLPMLASLKTVDTELLAPRTTNALNNQFYVCQAPGGYVKFYYSNTGVFFEFTSTTEFL